MKKGFFLSFITITFLFATILVNIPKITFAYQNSAYYNDIRIGLKSMSAASLSITLNGSYSINGQALPTGSSYLLTISGGKIIFDGQAYDNFSLLPLNDGSTITIKSVSKTYKYLGNMQFKILNSLILPINSLNIEQYLKGVVGAEMSDYFPLEALKAQAVAARNYTLANIGLFNTSGYDLTDTTETQVYQGYNETYTNVIKAVNDTKGIVQLYNEALVNAYYSASNGGFSEASENVWTSSLPYLNAKLDTFDNNNWPNGNITLTNTQIDSMLKSKGYLTSGDNFVKLDLSSITRYTSGRVSNINVIYTNSLGAQTTKSFVKSKAYTFLSLPSAMYNVNYDSSTGNYLFSGKGYGHGIGLSQLGAKARAQAGQSYTSILNFYYDGSYSQSLLPTISSFNLNKTSTIVGQPVSTNIVATGGSGSGYLYKYVVTKDNTVVFTESYSENNTFNYSPNLIGTYNVAVYLKDKLSKNDFDTTANLNFTAYSNSQITNTTFSGTLYEKRPVTISTQANYDSTTSPVYKFEVYNSSGVLSYSQEYSSTPNFTFTPAISGSYLVKVFVKGDINNINYDDFKEYTLTIKKEPVVVSKLPISFGMKGNDVIQIQTGLSNLGYRLGSLDGLFEKKTYNAVMSFQNSKGIIQTGIVDQATLDALNNALITKITGIK